MKLSYLFFFSAFVFAIAVSLKRNYKEEGRYIVTSQIKGIAIALVILGHLSRVAGIEKPLVNLLGANGVTLFLLVSGFGLYKSYSTKGINGSYWTKRILTVLLPYSIITAIFLGYNVVFLGEEYSKAYVIKNILGIESLTRFDGTMWYIQFILSWYIIFGIVFYFKGLRPVRMLILFLVSLVFYSQMNRTPFSMYYYQCAVHSFSFAIGALFAKYDYKFHQYIKSNKIMILIIFIAALLAFNLYGSVSINNNLYIIYNLSIAVVIMSLTQLLSNLNINSRLLIYIGSISFYLYLFEGVFLYNYNLIQMETPYFSLLKYFLVVYIFSLLYSKLIEFGVKGSKKLLKP